MGVPSPTPLNVSGTIAGSVLPLRRAEELIATLPGVLSVRIVPGETGAIEEVHVLTTDAVPPKATVRNIESALMAQLGLRVNHRKISIATTLDSSRAIDRPVPREAEPEAERSPVLTAERVSARQPEASAASSFGASSLGTSSFSSSMEPPVSRAASAGPAGRVGLGRTATTANTLAASEGRRVLIFEDVEVRRSRTKGVLCRVTLSREDTHFVGEAEGQETERSRVELAARAALQAIAEVAAASAGGERSLALEGSKLIDAFDRTFIFVSVTARIGREMVVLTGSCEVRESAETSAVLAVLDATNRWLHLER
jgi:hypothetical protein